MIGRTDHPSAQSRPEVDRPWRPGPLRRGTDPDPRFTLANERTFLAWIRTALGIVAAALALETLGAGLIEPTLRRWVVCVLLGFAMMLTTAAFGRWFRIEVAMRLGRPLPLPGIMLLVAVFVVVTCGTIAVLALS